MAFTANLIIDQNLPVRSLWGMKFSRDTTHDTSFLELQLNMDMCKDECQNLGSRGR